MNAPTQNVSGNAVGLDDAEPSASPFQTPYPSYQVLAKWDSPSFDDATRRVVAHRLDHVPERRFFDEAAYQLLRAVVDCVLPQPERDGPGRIPVEAFIDETLHLNTGNGTRFAGTPTHRAAWLQGLRCIQHEAGRRDEKDFEQLTATRQSALMRAMDAGDVDVGSDAWHGLDPQRFFRDVLLKDAVKAYYAHPFAWNEIGFGGPAAPRGYVRLGPNDRDPWEAIEERAPQSLKGGPV